MVVVGNLACTLYDLRRFVIECPPMKRTLLAVGIAILVSMLLVPFGSYPFRGSYGEPRNGSLI